MKILISTGLFPPDIGGPSQYAKNMQDVWVKAGHKVSVATYTYERKFPTGIRHILFFFKVLVKMVRQFFQTDFIFVLDTWSAALPTLWTCRLTGKKYVIRTGGDFLWEEYVERTKEKVLFRNFYEHVGASLQNLEHSKLSKKERIIFKLTRTVLKGADTVIFSTNWQREIFEKAYGLNPEKSKIVENYCGISKSEHNQVQDQKKWQTKDDMVFLAGTRNRVWKNGDLLASAFAKAQEQIVSMALKSGLESPKIILDTTQAKYGEFMERMRNSYAVILVSLGDISPNLIFDAIKLGVPFIVTKEVGIYERIKECAVFVDPLDEKDIIDKIIWMSDPNNREAQRKKVAEFKWAHSWEQIGKEILNVNANLNAK